MKHISQLCVAGIVALSLAGAAPADGQSTPDPAIVATVERFHQLLAAGDSAGATQLLARDLTVLEGGGVETLEQYVGRHLRSDMEFAQAVSGERKVVSVQQVGDVAWVVSTSTTKGMIRDRPVDSRGAELMVLGRTDGGWRIRAVHWSSRRGSP